MTGTISKNCDFDVEAACEKLKNAMDGLGTNESDIIDVLVNHDCEQRQEIKMIYKQLYGEELVDDLKSELGGNLETVIVALLDSPRVFDAHEIHRAISCMGTDENTLIEIMVTRTDEEIQEIKEVYEDEYGTSMEEDIASDTSGYFRRFMVSLCTAARDDSYWASPTEEAVTSDAQEIFDAGEGQFGTDECAFNAILCRRSIAHLNALAEAYASLSGKTLKEAIESETSGAVRDGYLAVLEAASNPQKYFAQCLHKSMQGAGTTDTDLIRVIVSRSEIDLEDIKECFAEMYEQPLSEWVDSDCGGDYKRVLLKIIK